MSQEWDALKQEVRLARRALLWPLAVMWAVEIVNVFVGGRLNAFGIAPRTVAVLAGILLAHVEASGPGAAGTGVWDDWLRDGAEPAVLGDTPTIDPAAQILTSPVEAEDPT